MQVGANVREVRTQRGLTLAELAEAAGLSKGFVSQVENDKTSPSLDTLERLADALSVAVVELLRVPAPVPPPPTVVRRVLPPADAPARRTPDVVALTPPGSALGLYVVELPAGAALGDSSHAHEGAECCLVLAGRVQADQAGAWLTLEAGDAVSWTPGQRHRLINSGPGPARLVVGLSAPATLGAALPAASHLQAAGARDGAQAAGERPLRLVQMRAAARQTGRRRE